MRVFCRSLVFCECLSFTLALVLGRNATGQLSLVELVTVLALRHALTPGHALKLLETLAVSQLTGRLVRGPAARLTASRHTEFRGKLCNIPRQK